MRNAYTGASLFRIIDVKKILYLFTQLPVLG
jgi:hypothetical protein